MPWKQFCLLSPLLSLFPSVYRLDLATSHSRIEHRCQNMSWIDIPILKRVGDSGLMVANTTGREVAHRASLCYDLEPVCIWPVEEPRVSTSVCTYLKRKERREKRQIPIHRGSPMGSLSLYANSILFQKCNFCSWELRVNSGKQHGLWSMMEPEDQFPSIM